MRNVKKFINNHLNVSIVVFFQFFGTALFGFININLINKMYNTTSAAYKELYTSVDFALSLFICISYGRQFSGGLYNPAITMFRMFRKNQRIPVKSGLIYMATQFLGSLCGCCFAFWANDLTFASINMVLPIGIQMKKFGVEIIGTCVFAVILQMTIERKMTFIEHNRQFYICIPLFFMICRQYASLSNGLNPALGFGYQVSFSLYQGEWSVLPMAYILIFGPYIGAALAVLLFQYVLKPLYPLKLDQIMKDVQKVKKKNSIKQQAGSSLAKTFLTLKDIEYKSQKYSFGQVINIKPQNEVYFDADDDFTMISELHNQNFNYVEQNQLNKPYQQQQIKIMEEPDMTKAISFRVMSKFNY